MLLPALSGGHVQNLFGAPIAEAPGIVVQKTAANGDDATTATMPQRQPFSPVFMRVS
jgi:hypothetical protein